jgi:D-sedoheptulose 7-phosphate isomerase
MSQRGVQIVHEYGSSLIDSSPIDAKGQDASMGRLIIDRSADPLSFNVADLVSAYIADFESVVHRVDMGAIERVVHFLRDARDRGARIFVAGNGGSAATASHWVNDLCKATKNSGRRPMRAMSLADNTPWVTALANDEGYERVFAGQIENFAEPGDLLIVISASGNSRNLISAVEFAASKHLTTIGMLGFDGGVLRPMVDECIFLPTQQGAYQLVEDGHAMFCHILTTCLMRDPPAEMPSPSAGI